MLNHVPLLVINTVYGALSPGMGAFFAMETVRSPHIINHITQYLPDGHHWYCHLHHQRYHIMVLIQMGLFLYDCDHGFLLKYRVSNRKIESIHGGTVAPS